MSMVRCDECELLIDSDVDCDCFMDPPLPGRSVLCKECRDKEPIAQAINSILTVLDCFMAKANHPLTVKEIEAEAIGIGQILSRAQLILGFLEARKQTGLRLVKNG